ncbi:glutaredoxin family protein [Teredinibacter sp. KSP-S5-2]|uniref:glutaredoxin family protein n=1 Tax=Teredinibacter sp. KSP-S5-2 TaxID=3034506 RepID=UPI002934AAAD|nr:glutaredoxin family protein [Teredinibacter sp. KSP-S5-2]WNO11228.1 glutaredoxin family protein [Teredinibacter sp. KSP-S5-2]
MKKGISLFATIFFCGILGFALTYTATPVIKQFFASPKTEQGDYSQYGVSEENQLIIYTVKWCNYCKNLKSFLDNKNIPYLEKDIETSPSAKHEFNQLNGQGTPLILIGNTLIRGFNQEELIKKISQINS